MPMSGAPARIRIATAALGAALLLPTLAAPWACANAPPRSPEGSGHLQAHALEEQLTDLVALLTGRFRGTRGEGDGKRRIFHTIEQVSMPEHGELVLRHVISLEGFDDPEPFQQKFYAFDRAATRDQNRMTSIVLMRSPRWKPGMLLDEKRLIRFPPECRIPWRREGDRFIAHVEQGSCRYESAAFGGAIEPDMTYIVSRDAFAIRDLLYRPDGTLAVPGQSGDFFVATRVSAE